MKPNNDIQKQIANEYIVAQDLSFEDIFEVTKRLAKIALENNETLFFTKIIVEYSTYKG